MARYTCAALALFVLTGTGCHDERSFVTPAPDLGAPLVLAAGMEGINPSDISPAYEVDLQRLGVERVDSVYRLTTPAGTPFSFDVLTRGEDNGGSVRVSVAHGADAGSVPSDRADSLADVGFVPSATGIVNRQPWLDAHGDGFARMTISGAVTSDQLLVFETEREDETGRGEERTVAMVEVAIGPVSAINLAAEDSTVHPGIVEEKTLYSSDSWQFGLPTAAVSGDRTSVIVYEGDRADWSSQNRYEMRLQHDSATGRVTGGGSDETNIDSGHWRDHEIASLFNVLALAHTGKDGVTIRLSFDRGATFAQQVTIPLSVGSTHLVQIAMAADYSLAVLFWRSGGVGRGTELMLLEGRPGAVDEGGSPTWFSFDVPEVLFEASGEATPLLTGASWSLGGDLVVGFAFTTFESHPDRTWTNTTEFWCGVRPWGGLFTNYLVDQDIMVGRDPSVALLGSGPELKIFYAYEGPEGIRLRVSDNAGVTFSAPEVIGNSGAHTPTVFARQGHGGAVRVDMVYLAYGGAGTELHLARWRNFPTPPREDFKLTTAVMVPTANVPGGGGNFWSGPINNGYRLTQVAWLGYDAVLDGDEIVVVYDEETFDAVFICLGGPSWRWSETDVVWAFSSPGFIPADPPPLAPGMTELLPAPDPLHRHQLKLLRLN